jgi:hypothetical protein
LKKFNSSPLKKALAARWKFYAALLIVLGSLGAYNLAINTFVAGSGEATVVEEPSMATPEYIINAADSIDVLFQVTEIDTIREFIQVEYEFNPYGVWGQKDLYDGETPRGSSALILKPFVVQYEAAGLDRDPRGGISNELHVPVDTWVGGFQAPVVLYPCSDIEGTFDVSRSSKSYPIDAYCFDIFVNTWAAADPSAAAEDEVDAPPITWLTNASNGIDGYKITLRRTPYFYDVSQDACQEWAVANEYPCSIEEDANMGYSRIQGRIERAEVSQIFTWFVLGMIVLAAVCAVAMTIAVVTGARPPALEGLAFLAALLFAVQPLRGALPDAPPIGIDLDVRVFYICILAVLVCLAINVAIWIRRDDYRA